MDLQAISSCFLIQSNTLANAPCAFFAHTWVVGITVAEFPEDKFKNMIHLHLVAEHPGGEDSRLNFQERSPNCMAGRRHQRSCLLPKRAAVTQLPGTRTSLSRGHCGIRKPLENYPAPVRDALNPDF